jgi:hypothetical protein
MFPGMREEEIERVIHTVKSLCARYAGAAMPRA